MRKIQHTNWMGLCKGEGGVGLQGKSSFKAPEEHDLLHLLSSLCNSK